MTPAKYFQLRGIVEAEIGAKTRHYGIRTTILMTASSILLYSAPGSNGSMLSGPAICAILFGILSLIFAYMAVVYSNEEKCMLKYIDSTQQSGMDDEAAESAFYISLKNMLENGRIEPKTATL